LNSSAADFEEDRSGLFSPEACIFGAFGYGFEARLLLGASYGRP
jgi:hypothetical protein